MKKLLAISAMTLVLSTCGMSSIARENQYFEEVNTETFLDFMIKTHAEQTLLAAQQAEFIKNRERANSVSFRIDDLSSHVGRTWYVFSGSTPDGWDCSGLVMWFYSDLGVELEHSATAQKYAGRFVDKPLPGDIVAFSHDGTKMAFHNGIYIGDGLFIHSPRVGTQTRISSVNDYMNGNPKVTYTRIDF